MTDCNNYIFFVKTFTQYHYNLKYNKGNVIDIGVKGEEFVSNFLHGLPRCHVFNIEDKLKTVLLMTKTPDKNSSIKLPFEYIFLDVEFSKEELIHLGFKMDAEEFTKIKGLMVTTGSLISDKNGNKMVFRPLEESHEKIPDGLIKIGECLRISPLTISDNEFWFNTFNSSMDLYAPINVKLQSIETPHTKKVKKIMTNFVLNFLNFIYNPSVQYIEVIRSEKTQQRRESHGKLRLPRSFNIKLDGVLKVYMEEILKSDYKKYGYKFWVRGHFRNLTSPIFKHKRFTRTYVPAYIKGQGILIKKYYQANEN